MRKVAIQNTESIDQSFPTVGNNAVEPAIQKPSSVKKTKIFPNLSTSYRFDQPRIDAANNVQIRDARPLENLSEHIEHLVDDTNSNGAYIMLCTEDDVPLAVYESFCLPISVSLNKEQRLFSGEIISENEFVYIPFLSGEFVVGFIALENDSAEDLSSNPILRVYSLLISKELELADTTANLRYQYETVSRKQRELQQVIDLKNNILSVTTHDLRNPLTAVSGYIEILQDSIKEGEMIDEDMVDSLSAASKGVSNISELVEQLNEIALLELQKMDMQSIRVDLNWITQEVCDMMQIQAKKKKINLSFARFFKPLFVEVDIVKCKRIIANLVGNAIKYTNPGGTVEVSLSNAKNICMVNVKDDGIGISQDKIDSIFEPFRKLRNSGTCGEFSSGLGLFISNYLVRMFKGSITVESEENQGSTFSMLLPMLECEF